VKYAWIRQHAAVFPVTLMCRVLQVSASGYYAFLERKPSARRLRREVLGKAVVRAHKASKGIYGYRKVHQDLLEEGEEKCCAETVRMRMKEKGLRAKRSRKFTVTTDSAHALPVAENILGRNFSPERPNEKWAADITYIRTYEGWSYLAAVMDLYSRRIVGWSMSKRIDAQLVSAALHNAIRKREPGPGLLHHSDRGVQYASTTFQSLLDLFGITCSMSRKGNCWDNACMERFFASLKGEWIDDTIYPSHEAATTAVFEYIETFYNTKRRHAALGYKTPALYEANLLKHDKHAA
jgi:transposase InsO family protein